MRILIVDDEEELVEALVERLRLRGVDALGVTSGKEALELIPAEPFDVVLLDVKMPTISGLAVTEEIKKRAPELPVVLLTGHGSAQDAAEGMRLGAFDCLMKPVKLDELLAILKTAAGQGADGGA